MSARRIVSRRAWRTSLTSCSYRAWLAPWGDGWLSSIADWHVKP